MSRCFRIIKNKKAPFGVYIQSELFVQATGSELDRLRNDKREQTIVFHVPPSLDNFIALTFHAFKKYVCNGIKLVNYFYILHASSLNGQFTCFRPNFSILKVNKSGEDVQEDFSQDGIPQMLAERCNASSARQNIFQQPGDGGENDNEDVSEDSTLLCSPRLLTMLSIQVAAEVQCQ